MAWRARQVLGPWSGTTNAPEDLHEQVDGLVVGAGGGGVRLDADAVRSGGLCHSHGLLRVLATRGLLLPTFLLRVGALILRGRGLHQPHVLTVFFHPREDTVLVSHVSQPPRMGTSPALANSVIPDSQKGHYQRSLGVVSVGT